ncbi:MAG: hypothetical protein ACREDT_09060 [Methylocella sp.]
MRSSVAMQDRETLSRRDCLPSTAAAALGYTFAAGPVRAGPVKTVNHGLTYWP